MAGSILVRHERDPMFGFSPPELRRWLHERLADRVQDVFLFGSFGTAAFGRHSDIDLIIVTPTDLPFVERPTLFEDLRDRIPSLDLLVYTPEEFAALTEDPSPGFWRSVTSQLRRLL